MDPIVSIIIPFYNAAETLLEAVESVWNYPDERIYEIIIINDGSTQNEALPLLEELGRKGCIVIHQRNKGQAAARNTGLNIAKGRYILFLDSDNQIKPEYITAGISILDTEKDVAVVYGKPRFFGSANVQPRFQTAAFDLCKLLAGNYIDMCSVVRKSVIDALAGFDENREVQGHEDYDLWIRIVKAGWKFYFIDKELFDYRISDTSQSSGFQQQEKYLQMASYMMRKHADVYLKCYRDIYNDNERIKQRPFKGFWRFFRNKYLRSHQ